MVATIIAASVIAVSCVFCFKEPSYRGRPLVYWLNHEQNEATNALVSVGNESIDILLEYIDKKNSTFIEKFWQWMWMFHEKIGFYEAEIGQYHRAAAYGFMILGPKGKPAIPHLIEMMRNDQNPDVVVTCLYHIGKDVLPELREEFTNNISTDNKIRTTLLFGLLAASTNQISDYFVTILADNDSEVRAAAIVVLRNMGVDNRQILRYLTRKSLAGTQVERINAVKALGIFENISEYAILHLESLANQETNSSIKKVAIDSLTKISNRASRN